MKLGDFIQSGDWKGEKHVPVIEAPAKVAAGENVEVHLSIGKEIAHPNTVEHHIDWIKLYFKNAGKFLVELGEIRFSNHGELATAPNGTLNIKLKESGTLVAVSYCNLHGLWESSTEITVGE